MTGFRDLVSALYGARVRLAPPRRLPEINFVDFEIPDLPATFDGYRIAVLADLHHPAHGDLAWLHHAVDSVNAARPDLVALLGDYGESFRRLPGLSRRWYRDALVELTPALTRLRSPDGIVAVLGNHDYYADVRAVDAWLSRLGADVLVNRARHVTRAASQLRVAGMDDVREGRHDPLVGCDATTREPTIVLSHNPDGVLRLDPRLRVDLVLAGHTHGGQIVVPGYGAVVTMARVCGRRSANGWVPNSRTALYVSRGLGEQLPLPMRFNCRPEVLVLRLKSGGQQPA